MCCHSTFFATIFSMCLTLGACKLRPILPHSCWEDGQLLKPFLLLQSPSPPIPTSSFPVFRKSEHQRGAHILCSAVEPAVLLGDFLFELLESEFVTIWSREDAAITEQRTSDRGDEGPDQTRTSGSDAESQSETSNLIREAWPHVRRLLSRKLSKFVTSVYHLHPSSVNKHVICAAFPGPPTHLFHRQQRKN